MTASMRGCFASILRELTSGSAVTGTMRKRPPPLVPSVSANADFTVRSCCVVNCLNSEVSYSSGSTPSLGAPTCRESWATPIS